MSVSVIVIFRSGKIDWRHDKFTDTVTDRLFERKIVDGVPMAHFSSDK